MIRSRARFQSVELKPSDCGNCSDCERQRKVLESNPEEAVPFKAVPVRVDSVRRALNLAVCSAFSTSAKRSSINLPVYTQPPLPNVATAGTKISHTQVPGGFRRAVTRPWLPIRPG